MGYARKDVERTKMNAKKFVRCQEGAEKIQPWPDKVSGISEGSQSRL